MHLSMTLASIRGCSLTNQEFIEKTIGLPWENRKSSFESVDCHGLVMLYYKHVLNIDIGVPPGYEDGRRIDECWVAEVESGNWIQVDRPTGDGIVFTCYVQGFPTHVGLVIGGMVLHCRGSENHPGHVEMHSLRAIEKMYGKVTFHVHRSLK